MTITIRTLPDDPDDALETLLDEYADLLADYMKNPSTATVFAVSEFREKWWATVRSVLLCSVDKSRREPRYDGSGAMTLLCFYCRAPLRFTNQGWVDAHGQHVLVIDGRDNHVHIPDRSDSEPHLCLGASLCGSCRDIRCGATFGPYSCVLEIGHDGACDNGDGQRYAVGTQQTRQAILDLISHLDDKDAA